MKDKGRKNIFWQETMRREQNGRKKGEDQRKGRSWVQGGGTGHL